MRAQTATGHLRVKGTKRDGEVFYARIRRPDGSQITRRIGPVYTKRGRPPAGHYTEQTANQALLAMLTEVEQEAGRPTPLGITFGDAATEWLRYSTDDRQVRSSTLRDYRATVERLRVGLGEHVRLEAITAQD